MKEMWGVFGRSESLELGGRRRLDGRGHGGRLDGKHGNRQSVALEEGGVPNAVIGG